jgi:hypothetical protein
MEYSMIITPNFSVISKKNWKKIRQYDFNLVALKKLKLKNGTLSPHYKEFF